MKNVFVEVRYPADNIHQAVQDPIEHFVLHLPSSNADIRKRNVQSLKKLINNRYISQTSIIWSGNCISKIYGISLDEYGRLRYEDSHRSKTTHQTTDNCQRLQEIHEIPIYQKYIIPAQDN